MEKYTVYLLVASPMGYHELQVHATCKEAAAIAAKEQMLAVKSNIEIVGLCVVKQLWQDKACATYVTHLKSKELRTRALPLRQLSSMQ